MNREKFPEKVREGVALCVKCRLLVDFLQLLCMSRSLRQGSCGLAGQTHTRLPILQVPFRLTRMMVKAMEVSGIEGNFRWEGRCCGVTVEGGWCLRRRTSAELHGMAPQAALGTNCTAHIPSLLPSSPPLSPGPRATR